MKILAKHGQGWPWSWGLAKSYSLYSRSRGIDAERRNFFFPLKSELLMVKSGKGRHKTIGKLTCANES